MTSALSCLDEEARAIDAGQDGNTAAPRSRQFYIMLQDIQVSPFRGMGLLSMKETARPVVSRFMAMWRLVFKLVLLGSFRRKVVGSVQASTRGSSIRSVV